MSVAHVPCARLEALVGADRASVPDLLRARAAATPDAPFLRWDSRTWTYAEALASCERFAGFLRAAGHAGGRVASYLHNHPHAVWAWMGTQLAGSTYVPLNRSHRGALLADMIRRSGARVLVADADAIDELAALGDLGVETLIAAGDGAADGDGAALPYAAVDAHDPWTGATSRPHDLGMVMYTSGSTGRSKAVLLSHNQHCRSAGHIAEAFGMRSDDVWHGWGPLYHVFGQLYVVLSTLVAGGTVALRPRFTRSRFWEEVVACEATIVGALANMMRLIWALPDDEHSRANPARLALVMGRFADLHRACEERYGVTVIDCYGMTEAEPITLPAIGAAPPGSNGRPSPDFEVAILDELDRPLAAGELGEIAARPRVPDVVFRGYEADAERTVAAWRNLWFHTGDVGFRDEAGFVHFLERGGDAIRRGGENVSAQELEGLVQRCPGVVSAAAVGLATGPGEDEIKLSVIVEPDAALTPAELHAWCTRELAPFMVPRYIAFVERLPVLDVGKVDKRALRELGDGVWDAKAQETADA